MQNWKMPLYIVDLEKWFFYIQWKRIDNQWIIKYIKDNLQTNLFDSIYDFEAELWHIITKLIRSSTLWYSPVDWKRIDNPYRNLRWRMENYSKLFDCDFMTIGKKHCMKCWWILTIEEFWVKWFSNAIQCKHCASSDFTQFKKKIIQYAKPHLTDEITILEYEARGEVTKNKEKERFNPSLKYFPLDDIWLWKKILHTLIKRYTYRPINLAGARKNDALLIWLAINLLLMKNKYSLRHLNTENQIYEPIDYSGYRLTIGRRWDRWIRNDEIEKWWNWRVFVGVKGNDSGKIGDVFDAPEIYATKYQWQKPILFQIYLKSFMHHWMNDIRKWILKKAFENKLAITWATIISDNKWSKTEIMTNDILDEELDSEIDRIITNEVLDEKVDNEIEELQKSTETN